MVVLPVMVRLLAVLEPLAVLAILLLVVARRHPARFAVMAATQVAAFTAGYYAVATVTALLR